MPDAGRAEADVIDLYLRELTRRIKRLFGEETVGVYVGGSYALGAYEPPRSDIDVACVVSLVPSRELKDELVSAIRHESLACPARGLEFVLYRSEAVAVASAEAAFELNLNSGALMDFRLDHEPARDEAHWFPLDRSLLAERGIALYGPPAADIFASLPRDLLLNLLLVALCWHRTGPASGDDAVLNACRALRLAIEGVWSSKREAGSWALRGEELQIVRAALSARAGGPPLDPRAVSAFLDSVTVRISRQLACAPATA
jgi:predicted nucleotidyltransferase